MNSVRSVALSAIFACFAPLADAQQGGPVVNRAEAQALFEQMKPDCSSGSKQKACGVLIYSPKDCEGKEKDPQIWKVYKTYEDGTVRFQQGLTQIARQRPGALLVPFGMFDERGQTVHFANPQFLSWRTYQAGQRDMTVCGRSVRIGVRDFEIPDSIRQFLKANP